MKKDNLVLINSFYTNNRLLEGLIDYLADFFHVYFIDLPGFTSTIPALEDISIENYAAYVSEKIQSFSLNEFILGGISFGHYVASHTCLDGFKCKGMVAIVPYLNARSLKLPWMKKTFYALFVKAVVACNLSRKTWNSRLFHRLAIWYSKYPADRVKIILEEYDGKAYFETGKMILENTHLTRIPNIPTVLVTSRNDDTIENHTTIRMFETYVEKLITVETDLDHYPQETHKEYFAQGFPASDIHRIQDFFNSR